MIRNTSILTLLALILFMAYLNSFSASWHLDDKPNILDNKGLHIYNLKPESLIRTFFTSPQNSEMVTDRLYRPIPCMTFAINWYFGKDDVFGYHVVNLLVHILTAYLLFLTIQNLLRTPNLRNQYQGKENFIAFLTAVLWSVNPIQVQAVTYIVQRMASMAAMFYILSIYFYVKTRQSEYKLDRIFLLSGCVVSFLLALGSKQNTATLPLAVMLIEIICFQDLNLPAKRHILLGGSIASAITIVVLSFWLFLSDNPISFIEGYQYRPFSLYERLLTEPRIVLFYLSLIFYPLPSRLSIEHDITVSISLFEPWTTITAILFHLVLIGIGLFQIKRQPLLALAILFFYLNHVIESTIIPLELIFEHRNYLPSLFLFLPVGAGFSKLMDYYTEKNKIFRSVLVGFLVLLIFVIGAGTYIRNMSWATEKTLWEDAAQKAPNSHRPLHNLAWAYYTPTGQYDKAIQLYEKALALRKNNQFAMPTLLSNMALLHVHKKDYKKAKDLWIQALEIDPEYDIIRQRYVIGLIEMGEWNEALHQIDMLLAKHPKLFVYNQLKGTILLNQKNYALALHYFNNCLQIRPDSKQALLGAGISLNLLGRYQRAQEIFMKVMQLNPNDALALVWMVETHLKVDDRQNAKRYLNQLLSIVSENELIALLKGDPGKNFLPTESKEKIIQFIENSAA